MQRGKKLCAFLLALCLVIGFIPASVFAVESKTEVVGQQLYLGDDLTMHFYVSISDAHKADGVMNVAVSGGSVDYQIQNMTANSDGNYVFSVELGAPEMTEDITLTLTSGGEKVLEKVYSIQDYAHYLLENNYTSETKALVKEMLNYGAKAQLYFDHNTTNLANEGYVIESTGTIDTTSPEVVVSGAVDGIKFYGCSMVFESKIAIRYYFTAPNGVEGYTFTVDGTQVEPDFKSNMYYIEIDGIAPDAMDTLRTVKVAKDGAELSVQYSPVCYITRMYNRASTSQELKDLLVAAKGYFDAAKVFTGVAKNTLSIVELGNGSANAQFINVNVTNNLPDYTIITDKCNEETHILIDGQPWTNAEIKTAGPNTLVFKGMNGSKGTKLTILEGFSVTFGDVTYTTDEEYNFWWDGSKWGTEEVEVIPTISIVELGNGGANAQFINVSVTNDLPDYTIITDKCNEETHILIDGQPWTNAEIKTGGPNTLVFKGMNGSKGTKLTILEGFSVTFGDVTYFIDKEYNFWWDGSKWGTEEVEKIPTISIVEMGNGSANAQFINVSVANNLPDYTIITDKCNEETYILIDGQPWTNAEIKTAGSKTLVFKGMNGVKGTKMTILEGFSITFGDVTYFIDQEYNFWWDGSKWGTEEVEVIPTISIVELGSGSYNAQFFNVNVANDLADYTDITASCNEETHVLIDDAPWTGSPVIKTGGKNVLVFTGLNGSKGTKLTILEGFSVTFGDVTYFIDKEYNFWWDGSKWGTEEVEKIPTISIVELGNGGANAQFINVSVTNDLPDYTIITDKCNEETHILIDGQPWTNAEIKTGGPNTLVFKGMNGSKGTKWTILEGFSITLGDVTYFIDKEYNFWWDGTKWGTEEVEAVPTISIVEMGNGSANAQFINVSVANNLPDYTLITDKCNEETYILIDGQPWTNAEIKTGGAKTLVFKGMNGVKGTKMTILEGFSITFGDVTYFIDKEYNFWWDGTKWGTEEVEVIPTISIVELGSGSYNAQFFNVNVTNDLADYTDITAYCNEETHVLIDDAPWTGSPVIKTGGKNVLVFTGLNGSKGTKLTILEGFSVTFGDVTYFIDKEYNFWWDGSKWGTEEVEKIPTISIVEMGNGSANAQFINVSVANNLPDYTLITDKCNEETYILIDGQPWTNAEIKTGGAKTLVFKGMNGVKGTKMTILEGFSITFGDVTYFIDKEYNFWWDGSKWGTEEVKNVPTISIVEMGTGSANAQFINVSVANTLPDYTVITDKCNEETYILIDGQPWTNAEIKTGGAKTLVFKGMNGVKGTKMTILDGFSVTFGDVTYFIDKEYNFWWDGTKWGTAEVEKDPPSTLTIGGAGTGVANTIYLQINAETGLADWTNIAAKANEESYILINDQAWSTQEIGAISGKSFYINNIGADYGTKVTIKKGFTVTFNGITYVTEQDYNFWWNGAGWATENPVVPEKIWKEMPLGVFGAPYATQAAYDDCADAGFNFVLIDENHGTIDTLDYKNVLKYCLQAGMNPISMTFNKNNTTDFSDIPGFAGKFFYDEPSAAEFSTIASWIDGFEGQGYSNGIFLNNLLPSYAGESGYGADSYEAYLEGYIDQVLKKVNGPKWLSVDFYPLWEKTSGDTNVHADYLYNLEATAQAALAHKDMDLTVHYFVQTHGFGDQEWSVRDLSSIADIRYQYNCAMAYGVNAFSVFTYSTLTSSLFVNGNGLVTNNADGTITKNDAYYYVQQANNELKAWDEIYLSYDYEGTKAIGKSSSGKNLANQLKHNLATLTGTSVLSASNDTLIGQFDKNGSKAYMVSNYSNPANGENDNVIMTFANGTALQVIKNGVTEDITVSNGILTLNLGAGEAAFVIVK